MSKPMYEVYTKDVANMVCRRLKRENKKKDKEIERLNKEANTYMKIATQKQTRIDKAIEYILEHTWSNGVDDWTYFGPDTEPNILLSILGRSDKE